MTNETTQALVLRDAEGNYYRIAREVVEANRVPEDEKASLEEALSDDTGGFFFFNPAIFTRPVVGEAIPLNQRMIDTRNPQTGR